MAKITRRDFIRGLGVLASAPVVGPWVQYLPLVSNSSTPSQKIPVYVARNGTPVSNVQQALTLAGGIQRFVDYDDVVVLKPNGQWPNQGYTHTQNIKALIDCILARPGGFGGEILLIEHVHRGPSEAMGGSYCWNMSPSNRTNNWADMNYLGLMDAYHQSGHANVNADPLYDIGQGTYKEVDSPAGLSAGQQGWVGSKYTTTSNHLTVWLPHPILRSAVDPSKLIDLKYGVWKDGSYTGQKVKLIGLPTLNNHGGYNYEDYAGPTSALKCHIGIVDFSGAGSANTLHGIGYNSTPPRPDSMGEAVGQLITQELKPVFYMTCAEYTGYRSRTDPVAANTRTVGLCADPVTLDYWMCKHVMYPCATSQAFMNPDNDSNLRKALLGCHSKGVGTVNEAEMSVSIYDASLGNSQNPKKDGCKDRT